MGRWPPAQAEPHARVTAASDSDALLNGDGVGRKTEVVAPQQHSKEQAQLQLGKVAPEAVAVAWEHTHV